ncbi:UNVERIFIED_CONTAM: hypothetical protein K2H54_063185 [Gekko kuhli]
MEPQGMARGAPAHSPKDGPGKPVVPQKNAYARLVQKHHSGRFRSYLHHIAQKLQLEESALNDSGSEAEAALKSGLVREALSRNGGGEEDEVVEEEALARNRRGDAAVLPGARQVAGSQGRSPKPDFSPHKTAGFEERDREEPWRSSREGHAVPGRAESFALPGQFGMDSPATNTRNSHSSPGRTQGELCDIRGG